MIAFIIMGIICSLISLFGLAGAVLSITDSSSGDGAVPAGIITFLAFGFGAFVSFGAITAL